MWVSVVRSASPLPCLSTVPSCQPCSVYTVPFHTHTFSTPVYEPCKVSV